MTLLEEYNELAAELKINEVTGFDLTDENDLSYAIEQLKEMKAHNMGDLVFAVGIREGGRSYNFSTTPSA